MAPPAAAHSSSQPLSDEALLNWQQQLDEVQALEAIYGDSFRVLEACGVLGGTDSFFSEGRRSAGPTGPHTSSSSSRAEAGLSRGGSLSLEEENSSLAGTSWDAASLALVDAPAAADWELHCSLMVKVEPPCGSLRLVLGREDPQPQQEQQQESEDKQQAQEGSSAAEKPASAGPGRGSGSVRGQYSVQHLPPICLQLQLGGDYPSDAAPGVSLSALWLTAQQAAELEGQLAQLWQEQGPGGPICYSWADWLQGNALQHLGSEQELLLLDDTVNPDLPSRYQTESAHQHEHLGPSSSSSSSSSRPGSAGQQDGGSDDLQEESGGAELAEERLMMLLRYNAVQEHAAFQQATRTCGICFEDKLGREFVRLEACRHAWCAACLGQQASIHVTEGSLEKIRCPDPKCGAPLGPSELQRLLPADDFARWEQLTLQRTLDTMPDAAYCPRCGTLSLEDEDSCAQCPKCLFVFCSLCNEGWHPGVACVSAETKLAMLRRKMEGGSRAALEDLRRQEQELLSLAQIEKMAKKCPRCGQATQKAEGCNKMSCGGCGAYWCWRCGKEIDGYRHFRTGECILFDEAEILRWEAQWEEMQAAARVMAAGMRNELVGETAARTRGRTRSCYCPQCGQLNHKLGNNNMLRCWSCTGHFCYCCRAVLRGRGAGATHFGPRGCKQHSAD